MPPEIDETHDADLESWIESANTPDADFPIQNLPFGRVEELDEDSDPTGDCRAVVAIGDEILDLTALYDTGLLEGVELELEDDEPIDLVDIEPATRFALRQALSRLLRSDASKDEQDAVSECFVTEFTDLALTTPFDIGDYTDFYASAYHATNVGSMFRPDNPLLPNYKHIPIAYHGRASTVLVSGEPVRRPCGQTMAPGAAAPTFGPCKGLDYELEVGAFICTSNARGEPISIDEAEDHLFGICLVNDWSARDIQKWEYQPLGPFLAKSFTTTISPWVVTMEAIAPFRCPAFKRLPGDPTPLPHLYSTDNESQGGIDLSLEVFLSTEQMRSTGIDPALLSRGNFRDMYWTLAQMLAHHTSNGCEMNDGDLIASGTISGPTRDARGCLLELSWDGDPWADPPVKAAGTDRTPIELPNGETRTFLADGDEVIIRGYCERAGFRRIGLGECRGIITPALV